MEPRRGFIHIYTGNGKGKTTAAVGLTLRASGAGWRILFLQFLKPGSSSEMIRMRRLPGVAARSFGSKDFIRSRPGVQDRTRAKKGLSALRRAVQSQAYDLVVADEILVAQSLGLVSEDELLALMSEKSVGVEMVLTGRGATPRLIRHADVVTEMRERKHYYQKGIKARRGIEF